MTNVWIICSKELKSYFASPIAYLLMAFFALIFGFGFFTATRDFVRFSFQSQMMGQPFAEWSEVLGSERRTTIRVNADGA